MSSSIGVPPRRIYKNLPGVREYRDQEMVCLSTHEKTGREVLIAFNEGDRVEVDLLDLLAALRCERPELFLQPDSTESGEQQAT